MDVEQYLQERLQAQLDWHDRKSQWNQRWYKRLQVAVIAAGALIPLITGFSTGRPSFQVAAGVLGSLIAIATGLAGAYRFQENWIQYRVTAESLGHEKYRFVTGVEPYDGPDTFATLVERVEAILGEQNAQWRRTQSTEKETGGPRGVSGEGNPT